jgi:hypothetical protein
MMKKFVLTLITFFSSHLFAQGNIQGMQGRFSVNTSRCSLFSGRVPQRAYISAQSSDSLLVEFLGSEARDYLVHTNSGQEQGSHGPESYTSQWPSESNVTSVHSFRDDAGEGAQEVVSLTITDGGVFLTISLNGGPAQSCELIRNQPL